MLQRPRPTVLLTGFDPFDGAAVNPSWLVVQALHGRQILGHRVVAAQLPTAFEQSSRVLLALVKRHKPTPVLCVGQAGGLLRDDMVRGLRVALRCALSTSVDTIHGAGAVS